jgi:hypothetical protein
VSYLQLEGALEDHADGRGPLSREEARKLLEELRRLRRVEEDRDSARDEVRRLKEELRRYTYAPSARSHIVPLPPLSSDCRLRIHLSAPCANDEFRDHRPQSRLPSIKSSRPSHDSAVASPRLGRSGV